MTDTRAVEGIPAPPHQAAALRSTGVAQVEIDSVRFRPTTMAALTAAVHARLAAPVAGEALVIGYVNPHVLATAISEPVVRRHLDRCDHVCIDGAGTSVVLRRRGTPWPRLPAHEAFDQLCTAGVLAGRAAVIGIEAGRVRRASDGIGAAAPLLDVVAAVDGFTGDDGILTALDVAGPLDVIVIGAGSPRSEAIAELVTARRSAAVVIHAGAGTLKVHAGVRSHPPRPLARAGLGWVHRAATEPHARRRYVEDLPALVRALRQGRADRAVPQTSGPILPTRGMR